MAAPAQLLLDLAREGNAVVGGSFLAWRDGNAYDTFVLALPDGAFIGIGTPRTLRRSWRTATTSAGATTVS
jgi:hypothetical protein